jgi:hypothetical protein
MNSLIQNCEIILQALMATCADIPRFHPIRKPELSNLEPTTPNLTARFMMYNSEERLFKAINKHVSRKQNRKKRVRSPAQEILLLHGTTPPAAVRKVFFPE